MSVEIKIPDPLTFPHYDKIKLSFTMASSTSNPISMIDAHHHFLDPPKNDFQSLLKSLNAQTYLPAQYETDVIQPILSTHNVCVEGTVHTLKEQQQIEIFLGWLQNGRYYLEKTHKKPYSQNPLK